MQLSSSRTRGGIWHKLLVALVVVATALPLFSMSADASAADNLTVRINSPKSGDTLSGFTIVNFTVNPRHQLAVPARRENTSLRTWGLFYAPGETNNPADFTAWYFDSWNYNGGVAAAGNARANRNTYVMPGFGSVRPPRVGTRAWDTTVLPDGPATLMIRGWGIDGSTKDAFVTINVANKGASPDYAEFVSPKNGDTVSGWSPIVVTAMPRRNGLARGIQNTRWVSFLPSCLDIDINYWKVEYAQGANPSESCTPTSCSSEWIPWIFSDYGYISYHDQIPNDGKVKITPVGCPGTPLNTYNGGANWNTTVLPDGPASLRFTVVYNDGSLKQFQRVVNVQNQGKGVQYFGLDRDALKAPLKGDNAGIPGYADVPFRGIPTWTYELPTAYHACDIAAGDVTASPNDASWTMFWISDNDTWNIVRDKDGFAVGGDMRPKDWTAGRSFGRSGALCRLDTSDLANGTYTVRLRLQHTDGTTQVDMVPVTVQN